MYAFSLSGIADNQRVSAQGGERWGNGHVQRAMDRSPARSTGGCLCTRMGETHSLCCRAHTQRSGTYGFAQCPKCRQSPQCPLCGASVVDRHSRASLRAVRVALREEAGLATPRRRRAPHSLGGGSWNQQVGVVNSIYQIGTQRFIVPVACPMVRSEAGCSMHLRTRQAEPCARAVEAHPFRCHPWVTQPSSGHGR